MSPAAIASPPLQYFIHDDFDALRMEISGSLIGKAAQKAYDAWRTARMIAQRTRLVVDISFVIEADEQGKEILRQWRDQGVRIIASSTPSRAIGESVANTPVPSSPRPTLRNRLALWLPGFVICRPLGVSLDRCGAKER